MSSNLLNRPFHLLDPKPSRWLLIIVVGIFVIIFMNLYQPFNVNRWYEKSELPLFIILSSFGIIGMIVLAISQLLIREMFNVKFLKIHEALLWFLVELLLLSVTMYFIYGDKNLTGADRFSELFLTLKYTLLVLVIPYAGVLLYLQSTYKKLELDMPHPASNQIINFLDENDQLHIAIELDQILFLKAAFNYVEIFYINHDTVRKELVRTTMKKLENELRNLPIKRCHRSYMVNIGKISISQKSSQGLSLVIRDYLVETIPVSKNYKASFLAFIRDGAR